jgi:hypothetical protein
VNEVVYGALRVMGWDSFLMVMMSFGSDLARGVVSSQRKKARPATDTRYTTMVS